MTDAQKEGIVSPIVGMVIYQTDGVEGLYQYKTSGWETIDPGDISGTTNHIAKFTSGNVLGDSMIFDDGTAVSIGASGADPSAILQLTSSTKGFLGPKMSEIDRDAIIGPTAGLIIYNTTANKLNLWDGTKWAPAGGGLKLAGDADLQPQPIQVEDASGNGSSFYLGATSQGFLENVGIGTIEPLYALHIESIDSGILLPRMTKSDRDSIAGATAGLVIYQTDEVEGAYQYKTTGWEPIDPGDISGTANHVARFTANSVISNGSIYDDGTAVSIGASGADPSAIFQVSSTTRGFLGPKMTELERDNIAGPTAGILIYNTDSNKLNLWDGSKWAPAGGGLKLAGDADLGVIPLQVTDASDGGSSFYLGTNSQYFTGNVGFGGDFGITGPQAALEIRTTTSGILLPRMTKDQRDAIGATAGLVIYQTDEVEGAYQYKNTGWEPIDPGDISGTAGRVARFVDNSIINNSSIFDDGENVWIGPTGSTGSSIFSVQSTTKGVAIPLMTTVQKEAIPTPADGLLVTESGTTGGLNQYIPGVGWVQYLHDNAGLTGGTQVISGNLVIEGTLSAEAKSFRIDNPEKPGHKLVYGVAEGPEHSVFFRGRSRNNRIEMPEEWKWLVDGRSITVQLTPIGKWSRLAVDRIENGIIYVKDQSPWSWFKKRQKLHFFYLVQAERKDIQKLDPNP